MVVLGLTDAGEVSERETPRFEESFRVEMGRDQDACENQNLDPLSQEHAPSIGIPGANLAAEERSLPENLVGLALARSHIYR